MFSPEIPTWTPLAGSDSEGPVHQVEVFSVTNGSAGAGAQARNHTKYRNAPRRRYPQAVYDILTHYFDTVSKNPSKEERIRLAEEIKRIPGCEDYTPEKLYFYFSHKRQTDKVRKKTQPETQLQTATLPEPPRTSAHILYPSLANDASILRKLDVLLSETSNPTPDVAKIWAMRLGHGVDPRDITTYADLKRAQMAPRNASSRLDSQLPTPEPSVSPEPRLSPVSPAVLGWTKVEPEEDVKDELGSDHDDSPAEVEAKIEHRTEPAPDACLVYIAKTLGKALSTPPDPHGEHTKPPKTFKDLSRWFKEQHPATVSLENITRPHMHINHGPGIPVAPIAPPAI